MGLQRLLTESRSHFRCYWLEVTAWVALVLFFVLIQYCLCLQTSKAHVIFNMTVQEKTVLRIFWRNGRDSFTLKKSVFIQVQPGSHEYKITIPSLVSIAQLRIDPVELSGPVIIKNLSFSQPLLIPDSINFVSFLQLKPLMSGLDKMTVDDSTLSFMSTDLDPWFIVEPRIELNPQLLALLTFLSFFFGLVLYFISSSRVIKGKRESALLYIESNGKLTIPVFDIFAILDQAIAKPRIHKISKKDGREICQILIQTGEINLSETFLDLCHNYPFFIFRLQMNRSGEV
jgi:hypothetical protein